MNSLDDAIAAAHDGIAYYDSHSNNRDDSDGWFYARKGQRVGPFLSREQAALHRKSPTLYRLRQRIAELLDP
jgi:hypothetical protein